MAAAKKSKPVIESKPTSVVLQPVGPVGGSKITLPDWFKAKTGTTNTTVKNLSPVKKKK